MPVIDLPNIPTSTMFIGDEDKIMTTEWQEFFRLLYSRVGTIDSSSNDELESYVVGETFKTDKDYAKEIEELKNIIYGNVFSEVKGSSIEAIIPTEDNAIARWDGTLGKRLQSSLVYIDDSGKVGIGNSTPFYKLQMEGGNFLMRSPGAENRFYFSGAETDDQDGELFIYDRTAEPDIKLSTISHSYFKGVGNLGINEVAPANIFVINQLASYSTGFQLVSNVTGSLISNGFTIIGDASKNIYINQRENADMYFYTYNARRATITAAGLVGLGTFAPDKSLEINKSDGGEIRLTYNDSNGSATDYTDFKVGSDGDLTITTVDSDGTSGDITLDSDGIVNLNHLNLTTLRTRSGGIKLESSGNVQIEIYDDSTDVRFYGVQHGKAFHFTAEDSSGSSKSLIKADPDGAAELHNAGIKTLYTSSLGGVYIGDGSDFALHYFPSSGGNYVISNTHHGGTFQIQAENAAGTAKVLIHGDPDGDTEIYDKGNLKLNTKDDGVKITGRLQATLGWGDVDAYGGLEAAVTALGSTSATMCISSAQTLTGALDMTSGNDGENIHFVFVPGGSIDTDSNALSFGDGGASFEGPAIQLFIGSTVRLYDGACEYALAEWFGAVRDGTTDDHDEIQTAITAAEYGVKDLKLLAGTYRVEDTVTINTTAFVFRGVSRETTIIEYYNTGDAGNHPCLSVTSGEPSARIQDLSIYFAQNSTAVKANLEVQETAIEALAEPRLTVRRVRLARVYNGIDTTGNSGGSIFDDVQISSFNDGFVLTNCQDTVYFDRVHWYPFNLDTNQMTIFYDNSNVAISVDRADDLRLTDCFFLADSGNAQSDDTAGSHAIKFENLGVGWTETEVNIVNCKFDKCRVVIDLEANVRISNSRFYQGITEIKVFG
jgi:hypothetical protein